MTRLASWADFGTHDESAFPELWRGCVGAWAPCLGPSGTRLHDLSRYRNWGALTNMDAATDWVVSGGRYALDFDGSNDVVDIPSRGTGVISSYGDFSISLWVRSNITPTAIQAFFGQFIALAGNGRLYIGINASGQVILFLGNDGTLGSVSVLSTSTVAANQWVHVAATRNFRTFSIAVNGVVESQTTEAATRTILQTGNTIGLVDFGGVSYIGGPYFQQVNGQADDILAYNRPLSLAEIRLLATRRGIAYERRKRRSFFATMVSNLRRRLLLTGQT